MVVCSAESLILSRPERRGAAGPRRISKNARLRGHSGAERGRQHRPSGRGDLCHGFVPADVLGEVIVVDDGSDDTTPDEIAALINGGTATRSALPAARRAQWPEYGDAHRHPGGHLIPSSPPWTATARTIHATSPGCWRDSAPPGGHGPSAGRGHPNQPQGGRLQAAGRPSAANRIRDAGARRTTVRTPGAASRSTGARRSVRLPFFTSMHRYLPALFQTYRLRGRLRAGERPSPHGGQIEIQQPQSRPRRPVRSRRCHMAPAAHESAADRGGPAGRPSRVGVREPPAHARRQSAAQHRRAELSRSAHLRMVSHAASESRDGWVAVRGEGRQ